jgi:hypothetical protein
MMNTNKQRPLWRVCPTHRSGYSAPHYWVEAKTKKEAIKLAKAGSRLADFPESWSFQLTKLFDSNEF